MQRPTMLLGCGKRLTAATAAVAVMFMVGASARAQAALTVELPPASRSMVGSEHVFSAAVTGATEPVTFLWSIDGSQPQPGTAQLPHIFDAPGFHAIDVFVSDATGASARAFGQHLAYRPPTANRPTSSSSIIYDAARNRVYTVNQDNDTVTSIDADALTNVGELAVYRRPESLALTPGGKLWVVHQDDYAVAIVDPDQLTIEGGFRLPYGSQPVAVAISPTGNAAYITLMATGALLKLEPETGKIVASLDVGPKPRGIAVSHDGKDVYVTRFISSDEGGEVVKVDADAMQVAGRIALAVDTDTVDAALRARGVPNYLFSVALTPDGLQAWVAGKKDNILRGATRDGRTLTEETTVRPFVAILDTTAGLEVRAKRVDPALRSLPVHVEFSPLGELVFITVAASNRVEVRTVDDPSRSFSAIPDAGKFPRGTVMTPRGHLFVQGSLSRDVQVFDLGEMLGSFSTATPPRLASIPTVASEKLAADVLLGKQLFHNSRDDRMNSRGYLSCAVCHFDGTDDGRVYDFTDSSEGLRNTPTLLGRRGIGHGRLDWSGNLDEVQDFEHQIRSFFKGTGFLADDLLAQGARGQPLGDPKAGLSPELDAIAAYLASLDQVSRSPYKNSDGSLTDDARAGKAIFQRAGCPSCHGGADFTDSAGGMLHDVGTIQPSSGQRAGAELVGIDTPTLLGVWETPPYLHDGSAPTLRDVLTTRNDRNLHGAVQALKAAELDRLIAYLQQIDGDPPVRALPFDPASPPPKPKGGQGCACAMGACGTSDPRPVRTAVELGGGVLLLGVFGVGRARRRRSEPPPRRTPPA